MSDGTFSLLMGIGIGAHMGIALQAILQMF
jgi:hypothetical protein